MAYNKENYLQKIIKIQEITKELQKKGATNVHIFKEHIQPQFYISKRTFDEYLGIPAERELKKLNDNINHV